MRNTRQIAEELNLAERTVRSKLALGEIEGFKTGRKWMATTEAVKDYLARQKEITTNRGNITVGSSRQRISPAIRRRLEEMRDQAWVPDPTEVPIDLVVHRRGFHVESVGDKAFRWEQSAYKVFRSWFTAGEESWLLTQVLDSQTVDGRKSLEVRYRRIQALSCRYLTQVAKYRHTEYISGGVTSLASVYGALPELTIKELRTKFHKYPDLTRAWKLWNYAPKLRGLIDEWFGEAIAGSAW